MICPTGIAIYFCEKDWTGQISLNCLKKLDFARTRFRELPKLKRGTFSATCFLARLEPNNFVDGRRIGGAVLARALKSGARCHHDASCDRNALTSAAGLSRRYAVADRKTLARPARCTG